jgi:Tfp pilus assembly protein PilF
MPGMADDATDDLGWLEDAPVLSDEERLAWRRRELVRERALEVLEHGLRVDDRDIQDEGQRLLDRLPEIDLRRRGTMTGGASVREDALLTLAGAGDLQAMFDLGVFYEEHQQPFEAAGWYERAADSGYVEAMNNLGVLLRGQGQPGRAERWYRRAAELGLVRAMNNLGVLLEGRGHIKDAEYWWQRAVESGNVQAMNNIGVLLYRRGQDEQAEEWWRRAAAKGNDKARQNLDMLLRQSSEDASQRAGQVRRMWSV